MSTSVLQVGRSFSIEKAPGVQAATCCHEGIFLHGTYQGNDHFHLFRSFEELQPMEQIDTNMWKDTLQSSDLYSIAMPRLFVERATIHGFSFIYEGVKYAPRFREIHKELKGEAEGKWILFLDFLNVVCRCEGENRLYLEFTSLEQSQLMFRCNGINTPIANQKLLVERVSKNRWVLVR